MSEILDLKISESTVKDRNEYSKNPHGKVHEH